MNFRYVCIIAIFVGVGILFGCNTDANETNKASIDSSNREIALSQERKKEMKALEDEINRLNADITSEISLKGSVSNLPAATAIAEANLNDSRSKKDILEKKLMILYQIDKTQK